MYKKLFLLPILLWSFSTQAMDLGLSSSGDDLHFGGWVYPTEMGGFGYYIQGFFDFDKYENDDTVSVCRDGEVSGSTGSGTCSGHGGVSHTKNAEFDRNGVSFGAAYSISNNFDIFGGILFALYSSDVTVGDTSSKDFSETGLDIGASYRFIDQSRYSLLVGFESEQDKAYFGVRYEL